jgi:hypothetical protein
MNQLTAKMAHHSNEKLAGRKSKPSNQMRLKTYLVGAVYYGIFYSRDSGLQPTIQPTEGMIGLSISLGDQHLLPIIDHFRDGLLHHLRGSHVGGRGCCRNIALHLGITLILIDDGLIDDVRGLVSLTSHGVGSGSDTANSKWKQ